MIFIGSDHSGIDLKNMLVSHLRGSGHYVVDVSNEVYNISDDYPNIACKVADGVLKQKGNYGIAICGTGIGMSIACNKIKGIRAALCFDNYTSEMARRHNDANIICLGAKTAACDDNEKIKEMVDIFINTDYDGERHIRRLSKIELIEEGKSLEVEGEK